MSQFSSGEPCDFYIIGFGIAFVPLLAGERGSPLQINPKFLLCQKHMKT